MAYFSTGSEGGGYTEHYCKNCLNWKKDVGCPIWSLHWDFNYKQCDDPKLEKILSRLIPRTEDKLSNEECSMWLPVAKLDDQNPKD